jgi:hypothetical protein
MAEPRVIESYLARLEALAARIPGVDGRRLTDEVAAHLAEAASELREQGCAPVDAERAAVERFGPPERLIEAIASDVEGGTMAGWIRTAWGVVGSAGVAALVAVQVLVPSESAVHGPLRALPAASMAAIVVAAGALATGRRSRGVRTRARLWMIAWFPAVAAAALLSRESFAWRGVRYFILVGQGRLYLAFVAATVLLIVASAWLAGARALGGIGLIVAGMLTLLVSKSWTGAWDPLGGLGSGRANMAIVLIAVGWVALAVAVGAGRDVVRARRRMGGWMVRVGERVGGERASDAQPNPALANG